MGRGQCPSNVSRDARTHLKMIGSGVGGIELIIDGFLKKGNGWTDQPTNRRTDRPSYRDVRTHLKMIGRGVGGIEFMIDGYFKKGNGRTNRPTDRPSYGDARTHPKKQPYLFCCSKH